jgi:dTDP-4-amino-4,6-dideoxygalactose transaminase
VNSMIAPTRIPFLDLVTPHKELELELLAAFQRVLSTAGFIGGPEVDGFEREFAAFAGAQHCVGVSNGTDALRFALMASGVRPGDTVVTVPNSFIATTEAISQAGAHPAFVDVDELTYTMSPERLRTYLERECAPDPKTGRPVSRRTGTTVTAVVPVHLYGQTADMDPILELAAQYQLIVVEDACQAHGANYYSRKENRWRTAGSIGSAAAFSFYPGKNLGACGEAGAVTTNEESVAKHCRLLREHGQSKKYIHEIEGYNGRLDALQAALLRVKLPHLAGWNEARRRSAQVYDELLSEAGGVVSAPHVRESSRHVYHLYVVRVPERQRLQEQLSAAGIATGIHYPIPLHLTRAYENLGFAPGDFPVSEAAAEQLLSLPMFPGLRVEDQRRVVAEIQRQVAASV